MTRYRSRLLVLTVAALATLGVISPASAATQPYCGITWGSGAEVNDPREDTEVVNDVRAGRHACFDRLVFDVGGQDTRFSTYNVRYVPLVHQDGSGFPVPVRGGAVLQVILGAPAHDQYGNSTVPTSSEMVDVAGFRTFRQVAFAGDFEGQTTWALGVRARLPFRVFTLTGTPQSDDTPRLVIDVAHRW
ncbi:hypothetical protein E4P39_16835 [Blastococcus sp. CT_GayMR19]|uniref:AMIN-like domain-containing (lipo)protein n=1 Tax=Blastococcus sp. CT_GayMR19 TaxID=2559608 RepID=UPI0010740E67|nr:hypothetical protein [Blastococcus sp. CT_GayMR19]TFV72598.1 hypothetical protein E4P39_16835 [Blastococcus sp. CT_GayMR19]